MTTNIIIDPVTEDITVYVNEGVAGGATVDGVQTFTNKTLNLTSNTLSGTVAQFNAALSNGDFVTIAGTETLTNKTLTSPTLNTPVLGSAVNWNTTQTIASATTTDIAAATSNIVIVSGTTTITALGTVAAGAQREVTFSGALTLTHNATSLILPGSANITTAAGDTATFVSLGAGNWRCISYQKANGTAVITAGSNLNSITAATGSATLANGNNPIAWNWTQTTASQAGFTVGETTASTGGAGAQVLLRAGTLSGSTADPLQVYTRGVDTIRVSRIGDITLTALDGTSGSGSGGSSVIITAGQGIATAGAGGALTLSSGAGGSTSGNSGAVTLSSGTSTVGTSGSVSISTGTGTTASGALSLTTSSAQTSSGNLTLTVGSSTVSGTAGILTLQGGASRAAQSGNSGGIVLNGGAAGAVASVAGGPIVLTAGAGSTTTTGGVGGAINLTAGAGGLAATGGAITITTGSGGASGAAGDLALNVGTTNGGTAAALTSNTTRIALGGGSSVGANAAIALGRNAIASGAQAIAISGNPTTTASAANSTAIGSNSSSQGSQAVTGSGAMALGGSYASGTDSFAAAIANNTSTYGAQGTGSVAIGNLAKATALNSVAIGNTTVASQQSAIAIGNQCQANAVSAVALGGYSVAAQSGKFAYSSGIIAAAGDSQFGLSVLRASTTGSTVVMTSDGSAAGVSNQLIVASNQVMAFTGTLIGKQTGSANIAAYEIKGTLVNNAGTVTMPTGTLTLIGTDSITLTTAPTLLADNTNKGLTVTSGAKTATNIRWCATLHSTELVYA